MQENTNWTPSPEDNLLNLTDKDAINEQEAKGIAIAELYVFGLDTELPITTNLILDIHRMAFEHLYYWAGKWRTTNITVGQLEPPEPNQLIQLMYQFIDNLNFKLVNAKTKQDHIVCLVYAHYEFVRIHPFNNGNGRTGRIFMNLIAMKLGYQLLKLYHREGESRKIYINAMKSADSGNFELLSNLIANELSAF
ncbi:MAG: Fic family protein [Chitinophagaceae bacterium]